MLQNAFRLDGNVVVITGASGLLGRQHAEAVAAFGGIPVLLDLDEATASKLAEELGKRYRVPAEGKYVDVTNESDVEKCCADLVQQFGNIHGLVNNAANNPKVEQRNDASWSRLEKYSIEDWSNDLSVGLTGAFICSKHFGPVIAENREGGSIVNISSDLGIIAPDQRLYKQDDRGWEYQPVKPVSYSVVKSGLIGLTRYLATYWPQAKVRCNAICPGGVENNQPPLFLERIKSLIPMGRLARHTEYQGVLVFVLSSASSYLNGAIISVDGGRTTL